MIKRIFFSIFVVAFFLTSCGEDPEPTPEPDTIAYLSSVVKVSNPSLTTASSTGIHVTWEDERITMEVDSVVTPIVSYVKTSKYVYEGDNLVRFEDLDGTVQWEFTYDANNRLETFMNFYRDDTLMWGSVTNYTADNQLKTFVQNTKTITDTCDVTWENGDIVRIVDKRYVQSSQTTYEETIITGYVYDDKPNAYTDIPFVRGIENTFDLALMASKHNMIQVGHDYTYDGDLLIKDTKTDGTEVTIYTYHIEVL